MKEGERRGVSPTCRHLCIRLLQEQDIRLFRRADKTQIRIVLFLEAFSRGKTRRADASTLAECARITLSQQQPECRQVRRQRSGTKALALHYWLVR